MFSESNLFGFDDVPAVNEVEIFPTKRRKFLVYKRRYDLSISEIQNLLKKDLANDSSTIHAAENLENSSIFEDTLNPISNISEIQGYSKTNSVLKNINNTDTVNPGNTNFGLIPKTKSRQKAQIVKSTNIAEKENQQPEIPKLQSYRTTKKNIQNTKDNITNFNNTESIKPTIRAYSKPESKKKPVQHEKIIEDDKSKNSTIIKSSRNTNRKKCKTRRDKEEQLENITEKINDKFKKVEEFKLVVL